MPRKPRIEYPGAVHHVWARGNDRRVIFRSDRDRRTYLRLLGHVVTLKRWRCLAYCLMNNHVHLLIETRLPNLGSGMQSIHGRYGRTFNDRYGRCGHLFQGRFGSKLVTTDEQLWHEAAYVVRNPVRAGLCADPGHWPWSSFEATLGPPRPPWLDADRLLQRIGWAGRDPLRSYKELVLGR